MQRNTNLIISVILLIPSLLSLVQAIMFFVRAGNLWAFLYLPQAFFLAIPFILATQFRQNKFVRGQFSKRWYLFYLILAEVSFIILLDLPTERDEDITYLGISRQRMFWLQLFISSATLVSEGNQPVDFFFPH